uniref:Uncharacterized protein n=1 Tax=Molossus molossus TaxID=27622 RepID=A0A7J8BM97_MOLMO|nr:hypothetical protein HJG59_010113 [Molossus molossus]
MNQAAREEFYDTGPGSNSLFTQQHVLRGSGTGCSQFGFPHSPRWLQRGRYLPRAAPQRLQHASLPQPLPAQLYSGASVPSKPQSWAGAEKAWQPRAVAGQVPSIGASELALQTLVFVFRPLHTNCSPSA